MKISFSIILILSILLTVCSGAFASETSVNLDFSDWSGTVAHQTNYKYNNKTIITFHKGAAEGNLNEICGNGPYGNYYKSIAVGDNSTNVIYTFPGKDFASRTLKYVGISYVIRNTNTNRLRSNLRPASASSSGSTTFYEWENNILKPISNNQILGADYQIAMDPEKYYHFTIILDIQNRKWKLFIDGEYINEYILFENLDWSEGFYYMTLQNYGKNGQDGEIHLDEYKIVFLDAEGINIFPFSDINEDDVYSDKFNSSAIKRKVCFHIVNNNNENYNLTVSNPIYTNIDGFLFINNYNMMKKTLLPGYNRVEINSLNIPEDNEKGKLYFWESGSLKSIKGFDIGEKINEEEI